jgi:hypothetical protein
VRTSDVERRREVVSDVGVSSAALMSFFKRTIWQSRRLASLELIEPPLSLPGLGFRVQSSRLKRLTDCVEVHYYSHRKFIVYKGIREVNLCSKLMRIRTCSMRIAHTTHYSTYEGHTQHIDCRNCPHWGAILSDWGAEEET